MITNPFVNLLLGFQDGFARYGNECFSLWAVTWDESRNKSELEDKLRCIGIVCWPRPTDGFHGDDPAAYYIYGPTRRHRNCAWDEHWTEALDCFEALAARAGACLPLWARNKIPYEPFDPASWWLAFMWHQNPPSASLLATDWQDRMVWLQPFLDAAKIIETSGLNRSEGESAADNANGEATAADDSTEQRRGRGRPAVHDPIKDAKLVKNWKASRLGSYEEFARQTGTVTAKELEKTVNRVEARERAVKRGE